MAISEKNPWVVGLKCSFQDPENLYLIMDILYKFDQFQIRQTTRLGEYQRKSLEPDKLARPKGQLITEIYEHRDVVTCL